MTKFDVSAVWYPPAAVIILCLVAGVIFVLPRLGIDFNIVRLSQGRGSRSKKQPAIELVDAGVNSSPSTRKKYHTLGSNILHRQPESKATFEIVTGSGLPALSNRKQTTVLGAVSRFVRADWSTPRSRGSQPILSDSIENGHIVNEGSTAENSPSVNESPGVNENPDVNESLSVEKRNPPMPAPRNSSHKLVIPGADMAILEVDGPVPADLASRRVPTTNQMASNQIPSKAKIARQRPRRPPERSAPISRLSGGSLSLAAPWGRTSPNKQEGPQATGGGLDAPTVRQFMGPPVEIHATPQDDVMLLGNSIHIADLQQHCVSLAPTTAGSIHGPRTELTTDSGSFASSEASLPQLPSLNSS
jgi:hypothetical protein